MEFEDYKRYTAYDNILVLCKVPWKTIPLYNNIPNLEEVVNIPEKISEILNHLQSEELDEKLFQWHMCREIIEPDAQIGDVLHYVCFNVADYIVDLWGGAEELFLLHIADPFPQDASIRDRAGVWRCELENNVETHAFIIWIQETEITLISGYGGYKGIITGTFNKKEWFSGLATLLTDISTQEIKDLLTSMFLLPDMGVYDGIDEIVVNPYMEVRRMA